MANWKRFYFLTSLLLKPLDFEGRIVILLEAFYTVPLHIEFMVKESMLTFLGIFKAMRILFQQKK